jgi:hypothetical protein
VPERARVCVPVPAPVTSSHIRRSRPGTRTSTAWASGSAARQTGCPSRLTWPCRTRFFYFSLCVHDSTSDSIYICS